MVFQAVGIAHAKVQRLERSDRYFRHSKGSATLVPRSRSKCHGDTRVLAWGSVVLGFAGVWILHEEQIYFRHSECWLLLVFLSFSITQGP